MKFGVDSMDLDLILQDIFSSIRKVERVPILNYNLDVAIKVVEEIGKRKSSKFVIDDDNRFVFENLIKWVHADSFQAKERDGVVERGVYIAGATGTGKNWALEIMSLYTLIDGVVFESGEQKIPLAWSSVRSDSICEDFIHNGNLDKYKKMTILCIQDLGAELKESLYMGNRINVLKQLIEYRGDRQDLITLITSNYPIDSEFISVKYGDRVVSRLIEMCNYFELKGKDRRIN